MSIDLGLWIKVASFALSVGAMVYAWFASRRADVDVHFAQTDERMRDVEVRLRDVEGRVEAMPGKEELHKIELQLLQLTGLVKEQGALMESHSKEQSAIMHGHSEIMRRLETVVSRHEDHLLGGAR